VVDSRILGGFRRRSRRVAQRGVVLFLGAFLAGGEVVLLGEQDPQQPPPSTQTQAPGQGQPAPKLSADQLDSLLAPIALYSDDLLAQCLVASTYPIEVVQAQQWVEKNPNLKGDARSEAAMKQDWDPSIQALTGIPDALKVLSQDVKWTVDLGNAFLAQQSDVMDAVQRLRAKAKGSGKLETTEQQTVTTKVIEQKEVVVIQQASPDVIYVPSYSPAVIWGAPPYYPYPPLYYPPYYGGAWFAWGVGVAIGIGIAGGWGCGWGNNEININNNNNFNRNEINHNRGEGNRGQGNRGEGNRGQGGNRAQTADRAGNRGQGGQGGRGNSTWQHNPSHRGGAPYGDRGTASKFGGETRGQREARAGGAGATASTRDALSRSGGGGRTGTGSNRGGASASPRSGGGAGGAGRGGSSAGSARSGGGDRVGNRSVSRPGHSGTGFSGSGGGNRGASASRSRGSSSFGGGGRGGGGGGGRRR
jgi:hypothetical protein